MNKYNTFEKLKFNQIGSILNLVISNPVGRNCIDGILHAELGQAFRQINQDDTIRVVVLTGDPTGKAFCAGGDLNWLQSQTASGEGFVEALRQGVEIVNALLEMRQPVVAMVNGHAIGLGATLALTADVCFMDQNAKIADPHVGIGVVAGDGGALLWPLLIGPNRAKEFLMTGDALTGAEAARIGLVNHAVPSEELEARTQAFARRLAEGPRLAIELTKKSVNLLVRQLGCQLLPATLALEGLTFNTADHREAVRAFFANEKPRFGG